ncbi:MAG TPA: phage terminase large subunit [Firmicutes bacterium]|nr:phage terminase large subunit [Candidatus Fermentithermobacillaceae bacterium]
MVRIWEEDAKNDLAWFLEYDGRGAWQPAPHLNLLCEKLEAVERGEIKRLMVFMPPRHGKSEVVSKKFPAWFLGRNPDKEIIISCYAADLAYDFSRIARNTFAEWGPRLWNLELADDSSAVGRWGIKGHRGGLTAAGVGGPITGRGAHVAIVDDPFKNYEEAASETIRAKVLNWYKSTLRTRLAPGGAIVLVMTRWHEEDLAGILKKEFEEGDGEEWDIVSLAAIAEDDDILGRKPGEPLWPERYPLEELEATKNALGSYLWAALYQQHPAPAEGNRFKRSWFRYFDILGDHVVLYIPEAEPKKYLLSQCWCFQTCDPAGSEKDSADYFVLGTWLVTPARDLLLRDVLRERLEGPDQPKLFEQSYKRWHPRPRFQSVETKAMGLTLFQTLRRSGLPVRELKAETDKIIRALPIMARMEVGTVYFLRNAPWLGEYENELLYFPKGKHDDQVDMTSYAGIVIAGKTYLGVMDKPKGW